MPVPKYFTDGLRRNAGKPCNHPSCSKPRYRISSWCHAHTEAVTKHGHPDGVFIHPNQYATEHHEIAEFIKANLSHPGIVSALQWIDEWQRMTICDDPIERAKQPNGIDAMNRLRAKDITPQQILTEVAAIWLYSYRSPNRLPDDKRLTYAISRAVYNLAPAHKRTSWNTGKVARQRINAGELKGIGGRIRDTIGLLVMNIISTLQARESAKEKIKASFMAPFELSPAYLLAENNVSMGDL